MNKLIEINLGFKDKIILNLIFCITLLSCYSCGNVKEDRKQEKDSILIQDNVPIIKSKKADITKNILPEMYDYSSETDIYYKEYINTAYSDSIFKQYINDHIGYLDSLIQIYNNN